MDWKVEGVDERVRRAAENAAARAGVPIGEWIALAVRNAPAAGPEDIERALVALESRLEHSAETLTRLIRPLDAEVTRLAEETAQIAGENRRAAVALGVPVSRDPSPERLRTRRWPRIAAAAGAVTLIAGAAASWTWLWTTQDQLPAPELEHLPGLAARESGQAPPSVPPLPEIGTGPVPTRPVPAPARFPEVPLPATANEVAALRARAEQRDVPAEYTLGIALLEGRGTVANPREAAEWLATAAIAGHPLAQYRLGRFYSDGGAYPRDLAQSLFWTQSAAEQGVTEAAFELGHIYAEGRGVPSSHAVAMRWYREAARHNHAGALFSLGRIYEEGLDVRPDRTRALGYYRRAATAGSAQAARRVTALESASRGAAQPAAPATAGPAPLGRAEVAELQRLLKGLAFDPGATDGTLRAQTRDAIRQFQEVAGLPADGRPSHALLQQLREVAGAAGTAR